MLHRNYARMVSAVGWRLPGHWPGTEVHVFRRPAPAPGAGFGPVTEASLASLIEHWLRSGDDWLHTGGVREALLELVSDWVHPLLIPAGRCLRFREDVRSALERSFRSGDLVAYEPLRMTSGRTSGAGSAGGGRAKRASGADELPRPAAPARRERTFIAIRLLWERGEPVSGRRFRIEPPDGIAREGALDPEGFARVEGIESGTCGVVFPELDRREWRAQGGAFAEPWAIGGGARRRHGVRQGEHLSRVASRYGFHRYPTLWNHPDNAPLFALRKNPSVLAPGDAVTIPPQEQGIVWAPTSREHRFVVLESPLALRLAVLDHDFWPLPGAETKLSVDGSTTTQAADPKGRIERALSRTAEVGRLDVGGVNLELRVGHLDPLDLGSGLRGRLESLDYEADPVEGGSDEEVRSAVEEFQCDFGLPINGTGGPETQVKLGLVHGC